MKKNLLICIMVMLFLIMGCTNTYLKPTSTCQPLSAFDTLVITPFNGDTAFVEEGQYRGFPHDIAIAITERLKDQIEDSHMFNNVIQSSDCADRAIKIDGKIYSLIHNRRQFHIGIRGQLINCHTGESLYKFDNDDEQNSEIIKLPSQIVGKLINGIKAKLICEPAPATETVKGK